MRMEKTTNTHVETIEFTPEQARAWVLPPFQRPLKVNAAVREVAEQIATDGGVLPGIICFGVIDKQQYLIDGQQRREAFMLSEQSVGYADARYCKFTTMGEMAAEFENLNSHLVSMKPDDILRAREHQSAALRTIRKLCPFVGYDCIRRGANAPVLSMSVTLRCWAAGGRDVPTASSSSSKGIAGEMTVAEAERLAEFLKLCMDAWGRDAEYQRLWSALNLTLCMWIYQHLVIAVVPKMSRSAQLTKEMFSKCMMALSASAVYLDWLQGRNLCERERSPAYGRIKTIMTKRLGEITGKQIKMLKPEWSH